MIKIKDGTTSREPLPSFLAGLDLESLIDLSWTDPSLGVSDCAWWPEQDVTPEYDPERQQPTGKETFEIDVESQTVKTTREIEDIPAAILSARHDIKVAEIWNRITAFRDAREVMGFKLENHWFHSDMTSQVKYLGLKDKARDLLSAGGTLTSTIQEQGQDITWHTLDNADVPMTAKLAIDLVAAVATLQATIFSVAKYHKTQMSASNDPENYDFSTSWPSVYEGE